MDWSLRGCARRGHVTYAPAEEPLRNRLRADTPAGEAWRCLRCATFVVGAPQGRGPAEEAPLVLRGKALRSATILRLLAAERIVRALVLLALGYAVIRFKTDQTSVQHLFDRVVPAAKPLARVFNIDLNNSPTISRIRHLLDSKQRTLTLVTVFLFGYAGLQIIEAAGLWLLKRWGEYFAVVATSIFLPLEVYELTERVTALRVVALLVNVAAVIYLLVSKRLFGIRGGAAAYEAERRGESLLEVESAAAQPAARSAPVIPATRASAAE